LRWPRDTLYQLKLALTSPTGCGRSVGIVRLRTKTTEQGTFFNQLQTLQAWKLVRSIKGFLHLLIISHSNIQWGQIIHRLAGWKFVLPHVLSPDACWFMLIVCVFSFLSSLRFVQVHYHCCEIQCSEMKCNVQQKLFVSDIFVQHFRRGKCHRKFCRKYPDSTVPCKASIYSIITKLPSMGSMLDKIKSWKRHLLTEEKLNDTVAR
jgi:hypothetical protein